MLFGAFFTCQIHVGNKKRSVISEHPVNRLERKTTFTVTFQNIENRVGVWKTVEKLRKNNKQTVDWERKAQNLKLRVHKILNFTV
jgi:hypothetical protein